MYQSWGKLLFMHWPIDSEILRPLIPSKLSIDTFAGQAWIGVVPFTMWGIRASFLPPIPGTSAFHELNVRTYVHHDGVPGVWFFSLDAANSLAQVLRLEGNEIHLAHDGLEALHVSESHRPDVVILDIGMPKMNGYEVARRLREQAWTKKVLLVALTGWGQEEDRRRAAEAGFDRHLVKPVDPALVQEIVLSTRMQANALDRE